MKYETQNIFFIGDYHVGHRNVIYHDNRPFADLDEMHNELISRWNSVVGDSDIVYYLGDLSLGGKTDLVKWFLYSLKGKIFFIAGNHDKDLSQISKYNRFEAIYDYGTEIWIKDDESKSSKRSSGYQQIVLSHYPILSWNRSHHGSWHLHSHSHGNLMKYNPNYYNGKVIDVGCPVINYTPISYAQVKEIMLNKDIGIHH